MKGEERLVQKLTKTRNRCWENKGKSALGGAQRICKSREGCFTEQAAPQARGGMAICKEGLKNAFVRSFAVESRNIAHVAFLLFLQLSIERCKHCLPLGSADWLLRSQWTSSVQFRQGLAFVTELRGRSGHLGGGRD